MYYIPHPYLHPYYVNAPMYYCRSRANNFSTISNGFENTTRYDSQNINYGEESTYLTDSGPRPFVININEAAKQNNAFRTTIWTGPYLQVTLMSLNVGESIGLEMHPNVDQFIRLEQGQGIVQMGSSKDNLDFEKYVYDDSAIMLPAGTWHNLTNTGNIPLKLYSIYAPPEHLFGTIHPTKIDALAAEEV